MNCWICGDHATTGEHRTKASDLKSEFGVVSQKRPIYLHTGSMNSAMKDQLNVMSKFMALNMPLADVIKASTWSAAKAINHEELGHLSVGAIADVTVLNLREGKFGFYDVARFKKEGKNLLECEMTIKDGKIMYDLNALSFPLAK